MLRPPSPIGRSWFSGALAGTLLLAWGIAAAAADTEQKIRQNETELAEIRNELSALSKDIESRRGSREALSRDASALERKVSANRAELARLDKQIDLQEHEVSSARARERQTQARLAELRADLASQLRAAYVLGRNPETQLMLAQDDPTRIGRLMVYLDYFGRAQQSRMSSLERGLAELLEVRRQLETALAELEALKRRQQATLKTLQSDQAARKSAIAKLDAELRAAGEKRSALEREREQLTQLVDSLRQALARRALPPPVSGGSLQSQKGKLPWPVRGPLLASYGQPKADGRLKWNGLWIAADRGAPVRAVANGRVVYIGWLQRFGLIIIVEHDGGYFSLYGHNDSVQRQVGDPVQGGETIAAVGDTGGHPRTGLYFELRNGKEPVDPRAWLGN